MSELELARETVEELRDELRLTRETLTKLTREAASFSSIDGPPAAAILYASAAILHAFYTGTEKFLQAAQRVFNGAPAPTADWHRRLLIAAGSERAGRRPAIFEPDALAELDRYLRFRHVFRNLYVFDLRWEELEPLMRDLSHLQKLVDRDLERFDLFMQQLIKDDPIDPRSL